MIIYKAKQFYFQKGEDRAFDQFFVWNTEKIYIMDNHRSALWCWLSEIKKSPQINLKILHIDNHLDMSPRGLHCKCATSINFDKLGLEDYIKSQHNCEQYGNIEIFSYENFLRFFVQTYPKNINPLDVFVTQHHWEIKPNIDPSMTQNLEKYLDKVKVSIDCSQAARRLYIEDLISLFENDHFSSWIVDLDFDYFYNEKTNELNFELAEQIIHKIKSWYDMDRIVALTIAWSPEFLINRESESTEFGLEQAKKLNLMLIEIFKLDFPEL